MQHALVVGQAIGWSITDGANLFTPTAFLLAQDDTDSTNWGLLSLDSGGWTKETGDLATHVVFATKSQASSAWTISANSAVIAVMNQNVADATTAKNAAAASAAAAAANAATVSSLVNAIQSGPVASVNGFTGVVNLGTNDIVGLTTALAAKALATDLAAKQAASSRLDALVNLSLAVDRIIYATGVSTLGTLPISAFIKTLLDDVDGPTALTTLGLSTFIKTLIDDADASTALSTLGVSAFAKTFLDDADAATVRTTIGALGSSDIVSVAPASETVVGTIQHATINQIWSAAAGNLAVTATKLKDAAAYIPLVDASPIAVNWNAGINFSVTVTANRLIQNPTNGQPGTYRTILVQGSSATNRTITFDTQFLNTSNIPVINDVTTAKWYVITIMCVTATHFVATAIRAK